ncbi:MAG: NAD(P)H-dependent glycerol-3-phosphate dehydrogenase [Fidelibacterota bacterium]
MSSITILGTGSWGIALGDGLINLGHKVIMWQRNNKKILKIQRNKIHPLISNYKVHKKINFTSNLKLSVKDARFIVVAVPSHGVRELIRHLSDYNIHDSIIVNAAKGLEQKTLLTMSQVICEELNQDQNNVVSLYGPSHAEEVIRKIPTTLVAASLNHNYAREVQELFSSNFLRVYTNSDILGVELGGSLKNVIAIAAGICDGIGFGDNTKAAILTRGIAEITRLGVAMGARESTFAGLSGIGDLFVTCSSKYSRNRFVGEEIGKGKKIKDILSKMVMVAEGVKTAEVVYQLCEKYQVEMPISKTVYDVIYNKMDPSNAVIELMNRDLVSEQY